MEARSVDTILEGDEWQYEPKSGGFRCLLTRNSDGVIMYSTSGQNLGRYFPEVVAAALALRAKSFVLLPARMDYLGCGSTKPFPGSSYFPAR